MPMAASGLAMPQEAPEWRDQLLEAAHTAGAITAAAAQDFRRYARATSRAVFGRTARRIYLALFLLGGLAAGATMFSIASSTYAIYSGDLANPTTLINRKNTGTTILDRNGKTLYQVYGATTRTPVTIDTVPKQLTDATLAAEDPEFFNHAGFSVKGTIRAALKDLTHGSAVEGGSTLTQQLVKTTLLTPDRSLLRKAQELTLAVELEQRYSKNQILEMYYNSVYYGEGSYGIGTAAQTYFHKDVKELTLGESAMLAGLPLGPSRFDPAVYKTQSVARRDFVLDRMRTLGYITDAQYTAAKAEPLTAYAQQIKIEAPHFVFYVLDELRAKYGEDAVERGGITVTTSLDLDKQKAAEGIVSQQIAKIKGHNATNGSLVSVDPHTGDIVAMVGSENYSDATFGNVNITTSLRQPGSSWKPFEYLTAFAKGWNGGTKIEDKPIKEPNGDGTFYEPKNFDEKNHGTMTVRKALDMSLNIPAVLAIKFAGVSDTLQTARNMGITTIGTDESRFGLSAALGVIEVKPLDMAAAYATLANQGVKVTPRAILKVVDRDGRNITQPAPTTPPATVIDPRYAYMMSSILSDDNARIEEFGLGSPLKLSRPAAAKTGTTEKFRDDWTVGYTPDLATAVWVGNNDNSPINGLNGIQGAAPIWHNFMEFAHQGIPVHDFTKPPGVVTAKVCLQDGGLANPWDKQVAEEVFLEGQVPKKQCGTANPTPPEPKPEDKPADQPTAPPPTSQSQPPAPDPNSTPH